MATTTTDAAGSDPIELWESNGAGTEKVRITTGGNVGIGTNNPGSTLDVNGNGNFKLSNNNLTLNDTGSAAQIAGLLLSRNGNVQWQAYSDNNDSQKFKIDDVHGSRVNGLTIVQTTGNVGIGTTSPGAALHIKASGGSTDQLRLQNSYTGGKTWTVSVGADVATDLSIRNADANICAGQFHYDNTGSSTLTFRVGSYSLPAASGVEAMGVGQVPLLGTDAANYSDAMALIVTHGTFVAPNNGASAKLDVTFRNRANNGRFEAGYLNFSQLSGSDGATVALATYNGTSVTVGIFMDQNQNLGLNGNTAPTHPIDAAGGANLSGGMWNNGSSRNYKKDIHALELDQAIEALMALNPVKFRLKADESERHVGFIAEDVPELVANKDRKSLSPMDIVAVLTKVVQAQQKKLDELTVRMA